MSDDWGQHIGDDQLVHGLPKHMVGVASTDANAYWEIVPGKNACFACQAMRGKRFVHRPSPVHPNCNCEVRLVSQNARQRQIQTVATGTLQGYGDNETEKFTAGQIITAELHSLGPFTAGVWLRVDGEEERTTGLMLPGQVMKLEFSKFREAPVPWVVFLMCIGGDNSTITYRIHG
ncbi:hypothetical protein SAMN04488503_2414 [Humidesulfovibrio mexicanus]|uniref:Uncharacterized protein n=1 Tax=Humidesulfovibrio mexicanus TaxID=147047 RepID=A0A239B5S2_9BACT|nr:hypothetical protein [Humidesulfovibrio mexicanus]SNS02588.1 hypothetical protein SAMN04488503_2414 [Humidesulfovibrio mexicanus]